MFNFQLNYSIFSSLIATLMDGCTFDAYFAMTGDLDGLTPIWTYDCTSSRLYPLYVPPHSTVQQYNHLLKHETEKSKKSKGAFLIWNGRLLEDELPSDTSVNNAIISLGSVYIISKVISIHKY